MRSTKCSPVSASSTHVPAPAPARHSRWSLLARLKDSREGNVAILFGFLILPVFGAIGAGVDYGMALKHRTRMQTALDSAALAAGRNWQINQNAATAEQAARSHYREQRPSGIASDIQSFGLNSEANSLQVQARGIVPTPFLSVLGTRNFTIGSSSEVRLAVGSNADKNLEVSMMLDVTGSMSGQKLADLQAAAKDLIDIVVWDDQSRYTSRVALVPFSQSINVGPHFNAVTGEDRSTFYAYPDSCYEDTGDVKAACFHRPEYRVANTSYSGCVVERGGAHAFGDIAPEGGNALRPLEDFTSWTCRPVVEIKPLSSDRGALKATIDAFEASGNTAGHLGTAWAWYMLSPNWRNVWPEVSRPSNYNDAETLKIAVLMTDGQYNTQYRIDENGSSTQQARTLCANMKSKGITIYTVGFRLQSQTEIDTLALCASSAGTAYRAETGEALRRAFRDIAMKLANLRVAR